MESHTRQGFRIQGRSLPASLRYIIRKVNTITNETYMPFNEVPVVSIVLGLPRPFFDTFVLVPVVRWWQDEVGGDRRKHGSGPGDHATAQGRRVIHLHTNRTTSSRSARRFIVPNIGLSAIVFAPAIGPENTTTRISHPSTPPLPRIAKLQAPRLKLPSSASPYRNDSPTHPHHAAPDTEQ